MILNPPITCAPRLANPLTGLVESLASRLVAVSASRKATAIQQQVATQIVARDEATGLLALRPTTLWLHARAGMALRQGDKLAIALIEAPSVPPAKLAAVVAAIAPRDSVAARWHGGRILLALPASQSAATANHLVARLAAHNLQANIGWGHANDPDTAIASAEAALQPEVALA